MRFGAAIIGAILLFPRPSWAVCDGRSYKADQVVADLQTMTQALFDKDNEIMMSVGARMSKDILCMRSPAPPKVFAATYRNIGIYYHLSGNASEAERWFRTSLEIEPGFQWGADELSQENPVRISFEQQRLIASASAEPLEDMGLSLPEGTVLYLDGIPLRNPVATRDRPHILYLVTASNKQVQASYLIDGNTFPAVLVEEGGPASAAGDEEDLFAVRTVKRVRPPAKTPLLISGGTVLAGALGIYATTYKTNSDFDAAKTTEDMLAIQRKNNGMVIASGFTMVAGIGIGYTGVMLHGGAPGWFNVRF
jgi:hypothetical protein